MASESFDDPFSRTRVVDTEFWFKKPEDVLPPYAMGKIQICTGCKKEQCGTVSCVRCKRMWCNACDPLARPTPTQDIFNYKACLESQVEIVICAYCWKTLLDSGLYTSFKILDERTKKTYPFIRRLLDSTLHHQLTPEVIPTALPTLWPGHAAAMADDEDVGSTMHSGMLGGDDW